ncbi:hypothetical protein HETIRDRAFT_321475, partial [Heterobasidion irregulare TC 32-1]
VLSIYAKSTGKNSPHSWVTDSSNISAVSYIAAQLFKPFAARQFSSTMRHATGLKVSTFKLIKPSSFLAALLANPTPLGQNIAISLQDYEYYKALKGKRESIESTIKEIEGRSPKVVEDAQDTD